MYLPRLSVGADVGIGPYNEIWQSPASADIVPVCGKHLLCTPASICGIIIKKLDDQEAEL